MVEYCAVAIIYGTCHHCDDKHGVFDPINIAAKTITTAMDVRTKGEAKAGQAQIVHKSMEGFGVAAIDAGIVLGV